MASLSRDREEDRKDGESISLLWHSHGEKQNADDVPPVSSGAE